MRRRLWYLAAVAFVALAAERLLAARDAGIAVLLARGLRPRRDALLGIEFLLLVNAATWLVPDLMRLKAYP